MTKREIAVCSVKSHLICDCGALCLPFDLSEGRNAVSFPDFLLINPGEWQGWHSLIPRLREAPGILAPSKHRELPRLPFHCLLIPTYSSQHMKFPISPSTSTLTSTHSRGQQRIFCFDQLTDKNQWIWQSLDSRSLENYHWRLAAFHTYG